MIIFVYGFSLGGILGRKMTIFHRQAIFVGFEITL